jgi:hypothetical protein
LFWKNLSRVYMRPSHNFASINFDLARHYLRPSQKPFMIEEPLYLSWALLWLKGIPEMGT